VPAVTDTEADLHWPAAGHELRIGRLRLGQPFPQRGLVDPYQGHWHMTCR
jgi:hypothetical protein